MNAVNLPPVIFTPPDLFQKVALLQIVHEAVVVNVFRLSSDGGAAFADEVQVIYEDFEGTSIWYFCRTKRDFVPIVALTF